MITWKDRIEQIKEAFSIRNNRQLEQTLELSNGYVNDLVGGIKNKNPSKIIIALERKFKVSPLWFFDENVGMFGDKQENAIKYESELIQALRKTEINNETRFSEIENRLSVLESLNKQEEPSSKTSHNGDGALYTADPTPAYRIENRDEKYDKIPYVHNIAAGPPIPIDGDRSETVKVPSRLLKSGERYYAAKIQGESMTGAGILDGDLVLIRFAEIPRDGAIQVVRFQDKVTLKRLREIKGEGWELRYMDGSKKVITCDTDEYETLGEFVTVLPQVANQKDM